mgnify:CR=1 FL=1|tara:strand:+ start:14256 stop:15275 length:1020 start_codon:yes stop_codon:yes gene_type:complete
MNLFILNIISYFLVFFSGYSFLKKFNIIDKPDHRKIHKVPTIKSAGILIFINFVICMKFFNIDPFLNKLIVTSFFIVLLGFIDDMVNLRPSTKLISIIFLSYINLITLNIFNIDLGILKLIISREYTELIFSVMCLSLFINSFNYIDGIDGLASTMFTSSFVIMNLYLYYFNDYNYYNNLFLCIPLVIFLFFNFNFFSKSKMFMGDSGSLLLGFILGCFMLYSNSNKDIDLNAFVIIWFGAYYIYDLLSTSLIRLNENNKIFIPDQKHLHHILLIKYDKYKSLILCNLLNIFLILIGIYLFNIFGELISIIFFIILFFLFHIFKLNMIHILKLNIKRKK